jgi:hypothetical protein
MRRSLQWLVLLLVTTGCREQRSEAGRAQEPDVANRTGAVPSDSVEPGVELEAPRLIPAIRAQIAEIETPEGATEGNLTAFKNGVGALIDAMKADMNQLGVPHTSDFYSLSDSISRAIGGGSGTPADLPPEKARQASAEVERLIGMYEERMRQTAR